MGRGVVTASRREYELKERGKRKINKWKLKMEKEEDRGITAKEKDEERWGGEKR